MSVVDREALREAVEILADGSAALTIEDLKAMRVAVHASLAVLEGEATEWCKEHRSANPYALSVVCEGFLRGIHMGDEAPVELTTDCRMVRVVVVPIGEK